MGQAIEISRDESSAAELRALASRTRDGRVVRRLLAIALVLEGESREEAAQLNGMDRQTLRDWVHRYNAEGVAGLYPRAIPGRPGALTDAQMEPGRRRRGSLALCRSTRCDRGMLVGDAARALGGSGAAPA